MLAGFAILVAFGTLIVWAAVFGVGGHRATIDSTPQTVPNGGLQLRESYWPIGVLKVFLLFIPFGFYWSVHDLPGAGSSQLWLGLPIFLIAASGLYDLFFRRKHTFFPDQQRVFVESFSLFRGRCETGCAYSNIRCGLEKHAVGKSVQICAMFHYADVEVSFGSDCEFSKAEALLNELMATLKIPECQRTPHDPALANSTTLF